MVSEIEATAGEVMVTHINGQAAVDRTQHVGVVMAEVLLIVGNGVEAGSRAPSHTDQLSTRSKHTPKKVGDVGSAPHVRHHTGNSHPARGDVLPQHQHM
jgi:hypothetical protein